MIESDPDLETLGDTAAEPLPPSLTGMAGPCADPPG
jgi:hypothetical protein